MFDKTREFRHGLDQVVLTRKLITKLHTLSKVHNLTPRAFKNNQRPIKIYLFEYLNYKYI